MKIISKVLSTRIKDVLPYLISSNQTAYVKNRFISESGRLISDILEIPKTLALEGFLVRIDIEKHLIPLITAFFANSSKIWIRNRFC